MTQRSKQDEPGSCIIEGRLYWCPGNTPEPPKDTEERHYFCIDNLLCYEPFFGDFGPLHLGCLYRFCRLLKSKYKNPKLQGKKLCYYSGPKAQFHSNAAVLISLFQVIYQKRSVEDAYNTVKNYGPFMPFRDAATGYCSFDLTVLHCIQATWKALRFKLFDFSSFMVDEYEYFECVENGDLNILIPGKLMAFAGPHRERFGPDGYPTLTPADYFPIWKQYGVKTVVRLNKKMYEKNDFVRAGYKHYDMYFVDGTTPSPEILQAFIKICETEEGMIAVHCKAGLGRTGTLISCYMMKHYRMTAAETIAWIRLCRPGSIIGPQQDYVQHMQQQMWAEGDAWRAKRRLEHPLEAAIVAFESKKSYPKDACSKEAKMQSKDVREKTVR